MRFHEGKKKKKWLVQLATQKTIAQVLFLRTPNILHRAEGLDVYFQSCLTKY